MSPRTWIQALLLSQAAGKPVNAGGVYIPKAAKRPTYQGALMFGDDTEEDDIMQTTKQAPDQNRRESSGKLMVGNTITIRITRQVVLDAIHYLKAQNKKITPYIKFAIRQQLRILPQGPNQPPNERDIQDIFLLYEDFFAKKAKKQKGKNFEEKEKPQVNNPKQAKPPHAKEADKPIKRKNPLLDYIS